MQRLRCGQIAQGLRLRKQRCPKLRMGQFDHGSHSLADRFSKEVRNAVLGDNVMHVGAGNGGGLAFGQIGTDTGGLSVC